MGVDGVATHILTFFLDLPLDGALSIEPPI